MGIVVVIPLYCSTHKARDERRLRRRKEPEEPQNTVLDEWRCQSQSLFSHARQIPSMLLGERYGVVFNCSLTKAVSNSPLRHKSSSQTSSSRTFEQHFGKMSHRPACSERLYGAVWARAANNSRRGFSIDWHRAVCCLCVSLHHLPVNTAGYVIIQQVCLFPVTAANTGTVFFFLWKYLVTKHKSGRYSFWILDCSLIAQVFG